MRFLAHRLFHRKTRGADSVVVVARFFQTWRSVLPSAQCQHRQPPFRRRRGSRRFRFWLPQQFDVSSPARRAIDIVAASPHSRWILSKRARGQSAASQRGSTGRRRLLRLRGSVSCPRTSSGIDDVVSFGDDRRRVESVGLFKVWKIVAIVAVAVGWKLETWYVQILLNLMLRFNRSIVLSKGNYFKFKFVQFFYLSLKKKKICSLFSTIKPQTQITQKIDSFNCRS